MTPETKALEKLKLEAVLEKMKHKMTEEEINTYRKRIKLLTPIKRKPRK